MHTKVEPDKMLFFKNEKLLIDKNHLLYMVNGHNWPWILWMKKKIEKRNHQETKSTLKLDRWTIIVTMSLMDEEEWPKSTMSLMDEE
jgi:hypothetical protein